ncbi:PEP-CTERM sorting domain-containing protein [Aquabacterium sp.]|uniref:cohesin domain-containing protein n=1 Tax=Aquabacterium sp. TaxID=1872578 RepID=UPI0019B8C957|nr:PEP-CTERM sorting domain-containing protein [Aquabacterium sp.]MBC7699132.1 PEP-CTERM sorting domain-containing protein [Aquabacterium sp.]
MKLNQTLIAAAVTLAAFAAQAQTVSVSPSVTSVHIGDIFTVDLLATGFPDKIFGGGYNIAFDASILQLDDITFPASWEFLVDKGTKVGGTVSDVFFNTFSAPIKGDFLTSTLKFKAIGSGTSGITLSESPSFPFGDEFSNAVSVTYVGGVVNVAAVPEPGPVALMLAGMGAVGFMASRRRRQG